MARCTAGASGSTIASRHRVSVVRLVDYDGSIVERFLEGGKAIPARMDRPTVVSIVLLTLEHENSFLAVTCVPWRPSAAAKPCASCSSG